MCRTLLWNGSKKIHDLGVEAGFARLATLEARLECVQDCLGRLVLMLDLGANLILHERLNVFYNAPEVGTRASLACQQNLCAGEIGRKACGGSYCTDRLGPRLGG
jgi:hypothetical protein